MRMKRNFNFAEFTGFVINLYLRTPRKQIKKKLSIRATISLHEMKERERGREREGGGGSVFSEAICTLANVFLLFVKTI